MKSRIQISIVFPKELLNAEGNSLVADDLPNMYGATPIPKQPGMFSQYSHKVGERFENNDDNLPVATSTFLAEAHNRLIARNAHECSLGNQQQVSCSLHLTHDSATAQHQAQHIKHRQTVHKTWLQSREAVILLSCGYRYSCVSLD